MLPTYENGELVLVYRSQSLGEDWEPRRSQVIIAVSDGDQLIKRVVGLEGEYVKIKNGYIYINGKKYKDSWTHQNITYWTEPEETRLNKPKNEWLFLNTDQDVGRVPKGHIWVIGDNRHMSWYGMVKMKDVKGWVLF
jgi:signal peptidase I